MEKVPATFTLTATCIQLRPTTTNDLSGLAPVAKTIDGWRKTYQQDAWWQQPGVTYSKNTTSATPGWTLPLTATHNGNIIGSITLRGEPAMHAFSTTSWLGSEWRNFDLELRQAALYLGFGILKANTTSQRNYADDNETKTVSTNLGYTLAGTITQPQTPCTMKRVNIYRMAWRKWDTGKHKPGVTIANWNHYQLALGGQNDDGPPRYTV